MNFIPREQHYVIKNEMGFVICVIALWGGYFFPFVIKNGRLKRANTDQKAYQAISAGKVYARLMAQVRAIFSRNKNVLPEKQVTADLDSKNFTDQTEKRRLEILARYRVIIRSDGSMIKKRVVDKKEEEKDKSLVDQPIPDINTFIRCQEHIIDSFLDKDKGEIANTTNLAANVAAAHQDLLDWKGLDSWQKMAAKKSLRNSHAGLKRVTNRKKKTVRSRLGTMLAVKDSLGRTNPSSTAAIGALAIEEIGERIKDGSGISSYNVGLKIALLKEQVQIESNLRLARTAIQNLLNSYHKIWEGEESVFDQIDWTVSKLHSVWANPYLRSARYATALLQEAKKVLTEITGVYLDKEKTIKQKEKLVLDLVALAEADLKAALVVLQE